MKIIIEKNETKITTIDEWFNLAPPMGRKKQWKMGRSAMEMARFALSDSFPIFISNVLHGLGLEESVFYCEPEVVTSFGNGFGKGGGRNHDFRMTGKETLICIEAKVSEPFDKQVKDVNNERLNKLKSFLYGDRNVNVDNLYYQLFTGTVGSIKEAERINKQAGDIKIKNVVFLVLVFTGHVNLEGASKNTLTDNDNAFSSFCESLDVMDNEPLILPGAPKYNYWIKKSKVEIGTDYKF